MKTFYKIIVAISLIGISANLIAQNQVGLSQYMLYQPFLNPSAISTYNDINMGLIHRNQWVGFDGAPKTNMASVNTPLGATNLSLGLGYQGEEIGIMRNNALFTNIAYKFKVGETSYVSSGISLGVDMFQIGYDDLINANEDPELGYGSSTKNLISPLARFGLNYFNNKFYVTAFIPNLLKADIAGSGDDFESTTGVDVSDWHYYLQGGVRLPINRKLEANFSTLLKSSSTFQFDLNAQIVFNKLLGIGASYRSSGTVVGMVNFTVAKKFKIGYAYDYALNQLSTVSGGSHEIIAILNFNREMLRVRHEVPRF